MTEYRFNIIYALSDEELTQLNINLDQIKLDEKNYKEKINKQ